MLVSQPCIEHYKSWVYGVKKTLNASEQDSPRVQELRHDYRRWLDKIDIRNLVFVDKSGINLGMSRLFARSQDGQRAIGSVPGNKGKNISLIGALNEGRSPVENLGVKTNLNVIRVYAERAQASC